MKKIIIIGIVAILAAVGLFQVFNSGDAKPEVKALTVGDCIKASHEFALCSSPEAVSTVIAPTDFTGGDCPMGSVSFIQDPASGPKDANPKFWCIANK